MRIDWKTALEQAGQEIERVVCRTEWNTDYTGTLTGPEKRRIAIELLNALIRLPFPLSLFQRLVFGVLIDLTVYLYNRWWGHKWVRLVKPAQLLNGETVYELVPSKTVGGK